MNQSNTPWSNADFSPFSDKRNDRDKIEENVWVPCRLCERAFGRLRLTRRYCSTCNEGFCEGEHGNFAASNHKGRCTSCGDKVVRR
jgi:hypothetical protein